jgi:hypothetical protein
LDQPCGVQVLETTPASTGEVPRLAGRTFKVHMIPIATVLVLFTMFAAMVWALATR